jgi:hypothetical protein
MAYTDYFDTVEKIYIAYYQRPADPSGLIYWAARLEGSGGNLNEIINAFANSAESQTLYGPINSSTISGVVTSMYEALFGRAPEAAGLAYYVNGFNAGTFTAGTIALNILNGATGLDAEAVDNKLTAAMEFTEIIDPGLDGRDLQATYSGDADAAAGRAYLAGVTWLPTTIPTQGEATTFIRDDIANPGDPILIAGVTRTLTPNVDSIDLSSSLSVDTVSGIVDPLGTSTFSIGDFIKGNDLTKLNLYVASTGDAAFATVSDVDQVNFVGDANWNDVNAVGWSNIGSVNLVGGTLDVWVDNLQTGVNLSVGTKASGSLSASYTNDIYTWMYADSGSSISYINDEVVGVADAGGTASFSIDAEANGVPVTVGNVSLTGPNHYESYFGAFQDYDKGADITVGNVTITGAKYVWLEIDNTDHTKASDAVNTTVGNIDVAVNKSGYLNALTIYNTGYNHVGNLTVGNVSVNLGVNATAGGWDSYIENYAYYSAAADNVTVGKTTVGNVSLNIGQNASYDGFGISAEAYASMGSATVGDMTIGNVSAILGQSASLDYFYIDDYAYANGPGAATVGNFTIGNVVFDVGTDAWAEFEADEIGAYNGGGGAAKIGDVTIGNQAYNLGVDATAYNYFTVYAYGTNPATVSVGDITLGDFAATVNDGGYLYGYPVYVDVYGNVGDVKEGNLNVQAGVSADVTQYDDIYSYGGDIASFTRGNVSLVAGQNGYIWASDYLYASDGSIGNVAVGNVSLNAGKLAYVGYELDLYPYGEIGNVTIGNVSVSAAQSGDASFSAWADATDDVGNITVGAVSVVASGKSADAYFTLTAEASGQDIGTITFGNVSMNVNGENAYGELWVSASSAHDIGTMTFGNFDLSVGNTAKKLGSYLEVDITSTTGDVVLGGITLNGASVRGATDVTMTYQADFYAYAGKNLTVGDITVKGGDGASDNFSTLTTWIDLNAGGTVTIGKVDYSGYTGKSTVTNQIDVSGFKGAATIIGSAQKDHITDNKGTNAITGGAGADTFTFLDTNTGKTLATCDAITDFNNAGGDKIDITAAVNVGNYGEQSGLTDFTAFLTAANAANLVAFVGQVGSDSFAAIDNAADGTVDFVIKLAGVNLTGIDVASFV